VSTNNCTSEAGAIYQGKIIKNDPGRISASEKVFVIISISRISPYASEHLDA